MPNRQHERQHTSDEQNANPPAQMREHESAQRQKSHMHADNPRSTQSKQRSEGEGTRTADREMRDNPSQFASPDQVEARAEDAREAVDGDEGVTLERTRKQAPRGHEKSG